MGAGEQEQRVVEGKGPWKVTLVLCVDAWVSAQQGEMQLMLSSIQSVETYITE